VGKTIVIFVLLALIGLGMAIVQPVDASPQAKPLAQPTAFLTPTPGPDGRIIYVVQAGDSLWRIAAIAEISVEELMSRNGIQPGDYITEGMELELGIAAPARPTEVPGSEPTEVSPQFSPTPSTGTGEICVLLYRDQNGDARLDEGEEPLPNGQISVADVSGQLAGEHTTDTNPEGFCFQDLEMGDYNISAAIPPDHNPTTVMNLPLRLEPGDIKYVQFGAQPSSSIQDSVSVDGGGRSTLLGLLGAFLLIAGLGLGIYASRYRRHSPR
jgi:hypothetical protein